MSGRQAGVDGPKSLQARRAVSQHVPLLTALRASTLVDVFPGLTAGAICCWPSGPQANMCHLTALWACTLVDIFPGLTAGLYAVGPPGRISS